MEDLLILGGFASLILFIGIYLIVTVVKSCNAKRKAHAKMNEEIMQRGREVQRAKSLQKASLNTQMTPAKPQPASSYTYSEPQKSVKQDDSFVDTMMTAVVLNSVMNSHHEKSSSYSTRNDDVTYKDTGPSYSDSSPSSSWSSSSSSDSGSSWSSSDSSSPSSDW